MNYQEASEYWIKKDKNGVKAPKEELLKRIDHFIKAHNTLALATGFGNELRATPVEYNYYDGAFYLFSEGGLKFKYLEHNKNVAACIFDSYTGFASIHALQMEGTASIIEPNEEEFARICEKKGLNLAAIQKMGVPFHLIKITPRAYDYLDSDLKKGGYSNRQHLDC